MTPFVDVMLVLLVVFMVAAPMLKSHLPIDLPETYAPQSTVEDTKLLLTVTRDERVYIGETEVPKERMVEALRTNARIQSEQEVYIQADAELPYGYVTKVMGAVQEAGVSKVGLVTKPLGQTEESSADVDGQEPSSN